jgi:CHAD domain-containing protein
MNEDLLPLASAILAPKAEAFFSLEGRAASGEDAAAVHDMRVASRRLRESMVVFERLYPRKRFARCYRTARDAGRALGELRDADVLAGRLEGLVQSAGSPDECAVLEGLAVRMRAGRVDSIKRLRKTISSLGLSKARREAAALFSYAAVEIRCTPALAALTRDALEPRVSSLYGFLLSASAPQNSAAQHAARVAAKKFRYALETLSCCLGESYPEMHRWARSLQDALGELHDHDVLLAFLADASEAAASEADDMAAGSSGGAAWEARQRGFDAVADRLRAERALHFRRFRRLAGPWPESRTRATIDAGLAARKQK